MVPNRGHNRAHDFDDIAQTNRDDFDPEDDDVPYDSNESEPSLEDGDAGDGARDYYEDVGKSKLRKPKSSALGPQYRGSRVARDDLMEDEDEDGPFGGDFEDEDSLDENGMECGSSSEDQDDVEGGSSETYVSDEEPAASRPRINGHVSKEDNEELRQAVANDRKLVATSLAQSTKVEAEKGRAVKHQKATFDSLLNIRIKMQKSLVGANTIIGLTTDELHSNASDAKVALEAVELAAFRLWSSLTDMREELSAARTGEKRKRSKVTVTTPTNALWNHMQSQETRSLPHRNATLQRWSDKVKASTARSDGGLIDKSANQATIIESLQDHLSNRERLLKRAHTPRSCAPLQLSNKVSLDTKIYDDADFYGLLLKELLEQKSADSVAASNVDLNFSLRRETKTKKNVDTKASKGRKLRYTVHEKLQNFMAPEDRSSWSERQADELFGGLFGRSMGLGEEREGGEATVEDDAEMQDAGLIMFRT